MKKYNILLIFISIFLHQSLCLAVNKYGERDTYTYELKVHHRVVYRGQTKDPDRRMKEHERDGKVFTHMLIKGKAKTEAGAKKAERRSLETYRENHGGRNPRYNQTDHG